MSSLRKTLKGALYGCAMMVIHAPVFADTVQLNVSKYDVASLSIVSEGQVILGGAKVFQDYAVLVLDVYEHTHVVGTGTGGDESLGDNTGRSSNAFYSWGTAEVFFHCNKADIAIYQNDEKGVLSFVSSTSVATQYCPKTN